MSHTCIAYFVQTVDHWRSTIREGGYFVDGTIGGGGHAKALLEEIPKARLLGLDRDKDVREKEQRRGNDSVIICSRILCVTQALNAAEENLKEYADRVTLFQGSYADIPRYLKQAGTNGLMDCFILFADFMRGGFVFRSGFPPRVHGILLDLGMSSYQVDKSQRGFSFMRNGPLDMRYDPHGIEETAAHLVNTLPEPELLRLFREGGEPFAGMPISSFTYTNHQINICLFLLTVDCMWQR